MRLSVAQASPASALALLAKRGVGALALMLLGLAACGDDPAPQGGGGGGDNNNQGQPQDDAGEQDLDEDAPPDEEDTPEDAEPERLGLGELCLENTECASFVCFSLASDVEQGFCSKYCSQDTECPQGYGCVFLQDQAGDVARVCVPEALCLDDDGDGFGVGPGCKGRDCDEGDPDRNPEAEEVCDSVDNDCDDQVDDSPTDANRDCATDAPGVCAQGRTRCVNGSLECLEQRFASPEVCDGLDNDCDGTPDEGSDGQVLALACYGGPDGTEGVGLCRAGARVCRDGGFSDCEGEVLPFAEVCDGKDNDCDGSTDEDNPGAGVSCDTGLLGACATGNTVCGPEGVSCVPTQEASDEVCDGVDNDCDGATDEDEDDLPLVSDCYGGDPETRDVGPCMGGFRTCVAGVFGRCEGEVLPEGEVCDGLDNDCDGEADDGNPAGGQVCSTGLLGVCARGQTLCGSDGSECIPEAQPSDEVCDGLDNDCDGLVDEDEQGQILARACYAGPTGTQGVGVCAQGRQVCANGQFGGCVGQALPQAEGCDGLDNDCDGTPDDGNPGGGVACSTGLSGVCAAGLTACQGGGVVCLPTGAASDEVCDGRDNDCDGQIDEDAQGQPLERGCYAGDPDTRGQGVCSDGVQECQGGNFGSCQGQTLPQIELCDGLDNDCDGDIDDGNPGGEVSCDTGLAGLCAPGVSVCQDGEVACAPLTQGSAELCDGLDNDCDGQADEDAQGQPLTRACFSGAPDQQGEGICAAGVQTCQGGGFGACQGQVLPQAEACDGLDNDCDGTPDDGAAGVGLLCVTGREGVCATGTTTCQGGGIACNPTFQPVGELCDGIDNNCNGDIDDGFANLGETCFAGQGLCRRAGVYVCNPNQLSGAPICDAEPGDPANAEACNYSDDNCNGQTDEGFRDANGTYNQTQHCGGCGVDCDDRWPGGPSAFHVVPSCRVTGRSAACSFTCETGYVDRDGVPTNGCEFRPDPTAVYVATPANGGVATTCGAYDRPCSTLALALARAQTPNAGFNKLIVSDGVYRENLRMTTGISILGGHSARTWSRSPEIFVSVIQGTTPTPTGPDRVAVDASGVGDAELSGFTINGENAGIGGNSIAVYAVDPGSGLVIQDNNIFAGTGGNGTVGARGTSGQNGVNGAAGLNSFEDGVNALCNRTTNGGAGGARTCANPNGQGTTIVSGGNGGNSTCAVENTRNGAGAAGQGTGSGAGGLGGGNFLASGNGSCNFATGIGPDPSPGTPGGRGNDGAGAGAPNNNLGDFNNGQRHWRAASANPGAHGAHGAGGGGGGAAAGVDTFDLPNDPWYYGASGGGGGSGGCAGAAGGGGAGGGGSFGVFVAFSGAGPSNANQLPLIAQNQISRSNGGAGGDGGPGGAGGDPGAGAIGGASPTTLNTYSFCLLDGAIGSAGGRGGHGGGGAGGVGGASFDLYLHNTNNLDRAYQTSNTFTLSAATDTGGAGGRGGTSSNTSNGAGASGPRGGFGQTRLVP